MTRTRRLRITSRTTAAMQERTISLTLATGNTTSWTLKVLRSLEEISMALNKVTYQDLDTMLSDGWRILMQLGRDANGVVLLMQRRPDLDPELLEVTDGFFLGSINHKLLST